MLLLSLTLVGLLACISGDKYGARLNDLLLRERRRPLLSRCVQDRVHFGMHRGRLAITLIEAIIIGAKIMGNMVENDNLAAQVSLERRRDRMKLDGAPLMIMTRREDLPSLHDARAKLEPHFASKSGVGGNSEVGLLKHKQSEGVVSAVSYTGADWICSHTWVLLLILR